MVWTPRPEGWPRDMYLVELEVICGLPWWLSGKESACNAGGLGSIPGLGRYPGGRHGNPLQYSCLENPMGRGGWWDIVHRVTQGRTESESSSRRSYMDRTGCPHHCMWAQFFPPWIYFHPEANVVFYNCKYDHMMAWLKAFNGLDLRIIINIFHKSSNALNNPVS